MIYMHTWNNVDEQHAAGIRSALRKLAEVATISVSTEKVLPLS